MWRHYGRTLVRSGRWWRCTWSRASWARDPATTACTRHRWASALPGPRLRAGATAADRRKDAVQRGERLLGEGELQGTQGAVELIHGARPDDRGGDPRPAQQPGERHVGRILAEIRAQLLVLL